MAYRDDILALSPLAYWRLGESAGTSAADETGNGHTGTVSGATMGVPGLIAGDADTAYQFGGSSHVVEVPGHADFAATTGTMLAWIQTSAPGNNEREIFSVVEGSMGREILLYNGEVRTWTNSWVSTGVNVADGEPHLLAMSFQDGVTNGSFLSIDGVTAATFSRTEPVVTAPIATIGRHPTQTWKNFNGVIDEVAWFGTALSAATLADLYAAGTTVPATGMDLTPDTAGASLGTHAATLTTGTALGAGTGAATLATHDATLATGAMLGGDTATATLGAHAASLATAATLGADTGTAFLAAHDATLATGAAFGATGTGASTLGTHDAGLATAAVLAVDTGGVTLGAYPALYETTAGMALVPGVAAMTGAAADAALVTAAVLAADTAPVTLGAHNPTLVMLPAFSGQALGTLTRTHHAPFAVTRTRHDPPLAITRTRHDPPLAITRSASTPPLAVTRTKER